MSDLHPVDAQARPSLELEGLVASSVKVALVQTRTGLDQARALADIEPLLREAAERGAEIILTPEASNILDRDPRRLAKAVQPAELDPFLAGMRALAAELGCWILIGSGIFAGDQDRRAANRAVLLNDTGGTVATYDKLHMFDVDLPTGETHRESDLYKAGDSAVLATTPWGPLGLTICYDLRFPHLHRALAQAGATMIAVPAAFTATTGAAHWEILLRARAIETGAFILAPGQGGLHEDGRTTWGRSMVVDPWGRVIAQAADDEPGVVMAELDLREVARIRAAVPSLRHDRRLPPVSEE
jgi:predicted amidohydrolase